MKKAVYNTIHQYVVTATCREPLHVGSASGDQGEVLIRQTSGIPFIQASSISGVLRSYCESISEKEIVRTLFGGSEDGGEGRIRVTDGEFMQGDGKKDCTLKLELRPRLKLNNATGTVAAASVKSEGKETSGQKLEMQYVGAGARFSFELYVYDENEQEKGMILRALAALNAGEIQIGGQKSNGCGYITIDSVLSNTYDMRISGERKAWIEKTASHPETLKLPDLDESDLRNAYEITVYASTESELLVKGLTVEKFGKDAPKAENMKNAAGNYIIPGSSFKGAIRNRMEMIAAYMNAEDTLITDAFGKTSDKKESGKVGNLKFRDIVLYDENDKSSKETTLRSSAVKADKTAKTALRTRIRVDRFTGGVMNGALFSELNVSGRLDITVLIADRGNTEAVMGLLLFALRDLQSKKYAVGSGQNIGKGYLNIDGIRIADRRKRKEYFLNSDFKTISLTKTGKGVSKENGDPADGQKLLERFMAALKNSISVPEKQEA